MSMAATESMDTVMRKYERVQQQILPDVNLDFRRIGFKEEAVPGDETVNQIRLVDHQHDDTDYILTDLARRQIGQLFGFSWDRWFNSKLVDVERAGEEIRTRANKMEEHKVIRVLKPMERKISGKRIARGIVTGSYVHIDDGDFLRVLQEADLPDIRFTTWRTDAAQSLNRYSLLWGDSVEFPSGDYYRGIDIRNSDVGACSMVVDEYWWRLVCTNGMVGIHKRKHLYQRKHIGKGLEEFDKVFAGIIEEATKGFVLTSSAIRHADGHDLEMENVTRMLKSNRVQKTEIDRVQSLLEMEEYPMSRMGLVNAVTQTARDLANPNRKAQLEAAAGRMLLAA
jgi:hypothetical protein